MRIHTIIVFLLFILSGCNSLSTANNKSLMEPNNDPGQSSLNNPPSVNHLAARIVTGNSDGLDPGCPWLLIIEDYPKRVLDPINLPEEFQKAETEVWVAFSGMRRMNRCPEANPVWIQEIVLR